MERIEESILSRLENPLEEPPQPEYILSGSGFAWYYSDTRRTMVRVKRGSECLIFDGDLASDEKALVQIGNEILLIDAGEIIEVGWN